MISSLVLLCLGITSTTFHKASEHTLWSIGTVDGNYAEFALAPDKYHLYQNDPAYVIGTSKPETWPYILPGPGDSWAESRVHLGTVYFGLKGQPSGCRFVCDFVETHNIQPPILSLWINGRKITNWQAPIGNGDDAVNGQPAKGHHVTWTTPIPPSAIHSGLNELQIRNEKGSWVLFDALRLEESGSLSVVPVSPGLMLSSLPQQQVVLKTLRGPQQPIRLAVVNLGQPGKLTISGEAPWSGQVGTGSQLITVRVPAIQKPRKLALHLSLGQLTKDQLIEVQPVRPWTVYLLPHSHVDIGYTDLQPVVAAMHRRNLFDARAVAGESAAYPSGSRYRFNGEATWIFDSLLQDGTPQELREVAEMFRSRIMDSSANYCNVLTGLMRPEEMMRSYGFSTRLRDWLGSDLNTATQTDVPGVTWGAVAAMSQAGIKHLMLMPNPSDRIGGVLSSWQDKPFFWLSPSDQEKVLVWETTSYGTAHGLRHFSGDRTKLFRTGDPTQNFIEGYVFPRLDQLASEDYPYDCLALPWSGTDNYPVDADVAPATLHWNNIYAVPRVVVSTFSNACAELVKKYESKIPVVKGDFTPFWEDGAGSSARETALNRASADRMVQAETLCAMLRPRSYDPKTFWRSWSDVILYSEHTWGAYNSTSEPDAEFVKKQWAYKQDFAIQADLISRRLMRSFVGSPSGGTFSAANTTSWPRTDLVTLTAEQSLQGDRIVGTDGRPIPSQRLKNGNLAVLVRNVPAFGATQFRDVSGPAYIDEKAIATLTGISTPEWAIEFDHSSHRMTELTSRRLGHNFAKPPYDINRYFYLPGADLHNIQTTKLLKWEVREAGPLVASVRLTSEAPGARSLQQDIQVVAGLDRVDFTNVVDKIAIRSKEGVHFAFPFAVPNGQVRIQGPWAVIRPDLDQIAGSNKNWFTTQYFADVSNEKLGMTWSSLDAPLMEVGGITANMLDGGFNPKQWIQHLGPTQTLYSWALNNHWYTNYRADQEGLLTFRYSLHPHGPYTPDEAYRFGAGLSQPLVLTSSAPISSLLTVDNPHVIVSALKPSEDKKALIVRLWCLDNNPSRARLTWHPGLISRVSLSDSSERSLHPTQPAIPIKPWQVLTLRADLAKP